MRVTINNYIDAGNLFGKLGGDILAGNLNTRRPVAEGIAREP